MSGLPSDKEKKGDVALPPSSGSVMSMGDTASQLSDNPDALHRRLKNRHIQLIAIGGSIGTAICVLALVNNCITEMTTLMPVSGGFIRLAGLWVDDALGFMAGWNFFFYEALLIPFEITAINLVLSFWSDKVTDPGPTAGICAACIIAYGLLNIVPVRGYGEAEFWLSGGKVILIFMLFAFTFVTMVGGNPQRDAYGFRYWKDPGAFAEFHSTGAVGRWEGFLGALWTGCFAIVGPEYISMVAAEAKRPRVYIKQAFKTVYWRFGIFFILGALGLPYVIAMKNMGITVLPDITNFLMLTSIFSAGNTYTYCAIRTLYSLALEGRAPRVLTKVNRWGVPIYCYAVVMLFPMLSFLQVSNGSSTVLTWLVSLVTAGGLIDYIVMTVTYIFFYRACQAQGVDRKTFPYCGWFQPYSAWIALVVEKFWQNYTMVVLAPILFIGWKVIKKTKVIKAHEADLVYQRPLIDAYEAAIKTPPVGFWTEIVQLVGFRRRKASDRETAED
ncbi:unnamed protein product [Parascedosporium putredinis]|uniref:Amino acid permease/ SLC12A domain-containing protein n=1 Tax=Parascedosporium putredinis TaxID=1442378 RepID=A0A9P1H408_9PEZI|nr:unnamed protein product [Parascedosporium putredinis]CAI7996289.1 unnamed protein product [Parascedosporium putredinis]